jgi:PAS domain S-box-containing protein
LFKNKLFWKFFAVYAALLCLCLSLTGFSSRSIIKRHYLKLAARNLEIYATHVSNSLKTSLLKSDINDARDMCNMLSQQLPVAILVINDTGDIICQSNITDTLPFNPAKETYGDLRKTGIHKMYQNNHLWLTYTTAPIIMHGETGTSVIISTPFKPYATDMITANKSIIIYILCAFFAALLIGFVPFRVMTSPLLNITQIAQNFARGNFTLKAAVVSSDAIGDLAKAINLMGTELQSNMQTILDDKIKLDAIMAQMHDAIIATTPQERILLVNNAAKAIFGISKVDLNKDYLWEKIRNEKLHALVKNTLKTQENSISEIEIQTPERKLLQTHLSPIQIDKNTYGLLLVFHDITELRKLENTRREFVANVSHELRTPLASIKGYVETLTGNNALRHEDTQEFLGIIMKHTQRLDNLIKDILELSKLESHDFKMELHTFDIQPCIENIFSHYKEHCSEKNQTLALDIPNRIPTLETNEYLLRQLLTNLFDNAIKYTPKSGRIGLKVEADDTFLRFEISDTGIGIPQEHIPRIFERFYRVDSARSREMGGTGLGLSIVKHIVNLHHGTVRVESTVNVGSKFIITMPLQQPKYTT